MTSYLGQLSIKVWRWEVHWSASAATGQAGKLATRRAYYWRHKKKMQTTGNTLAEAFGTLTVVLYREREKKYPYGDELLPNEDRVVAAKKYLMEHSEEYEQRN